MCLLGCVSLGARLLAQGQQVPAAADVVGPVVTSHRSMNHDVQVVRSEAEEVIVGWRSARRGVPYANIYVQKVDRAGVPQWERDGTPLCPMPSSQGTFSMVEDGYGGVVVIWEDFREGVENPVLYAQRLNLRGEPLWGSEGLRLCSSAAPQRKPKVISDLMNGFYVVWEDYRQGSEQSDLYGQLLDLGGRLRWREQGMPIATAPGIQQKFSLATDEKHYLYLIWEDFRNGIYWNLYGQKIDQAGNFYWKAGGLDIFAGVEESHQNPAIVSDGYGGLLFVYQKYSDETHGTDIYRGRVNSAGEVLFHFATCYSENEQLNPRIVKKGSKAILCWEDRRSGNWDVYAQMIRLHDGILEWDINGVPVATTGQDEQAPVVISSSAYGYQVFCWTRRTDEGEQLFVQRLNNLGEPGWAVNGVAVAPGHARQREVSIMADEQGGLYCAWVSHEEGSALPYLQHINSNCLPLFSASGLRMGAEHASLYAKFADLQLLTTRSGEHYLAWQDYRNGRGNGDIYIQKLDANGRPQWRRSGVPVCLAPGDQSTPVMVDDGVGGVIVCWYDRRKGTDDDLYVQRLSPQGKVLWQQDGVLACGAKGDPNSLKAITDGSEGVILCWVDARNLMETGFDLFLQRVGHDGEALWGRDGKPIANFSGLQTSPNLISDGQGGAFLVWQDARSGQPMIYLQRINSFGIYEWEFGGKPTSPTAFGQRFPVAVLNYQHELNLVWQESRQGEGYDKLYMQSHTSNGGKLWDGQGVLVCRSYGRQSSPQVVRSVAGDFWVLWLDERERHLGVQLFGQRVDMSGRLQLPMEGLAIGESMEEWNAFEAVSNANAILFVAWTQSVGDQNKSVYVQRIDPTGGKAFGFGGHQFGDQSVNQSCPNVTHGADNRALVSFIENRRSDEVFRIKACVFK